MARKDQTKDILEQGLVMGRENASIIPDIRNWCRHIVLTDQSAGLLHEFYGVPTNTAVSCPHAHGSSSGMNLHWIAGSFIVENCIDCPFHQQIAEPNFGTHILEEKRRADEDEKKRQQKQEDTYRQLKLSIDALVSVNKTKAAITELSILRLAEELKYPERKVAAAAKLLESAKLEPSFFSGVCLDVLSLYFRHEEIGDTCLRTVNEILKTKQHFPEALFLQAVETLSTQTNFNGVALLFHYYIHANNIRAHDETISLLIRCLSYVREFPVPDELRNDYVDSINALHHLIAVDREYMQAIFQRFVLLEDSLMRINICGILQDILVKDLSFVLALVPELTQSFEYVDAAQFDSADLATAKTLGKLVKTSPGTVYPSIKESINRLKDPGRTGAVRLYAILLNDQTFIAMHPDFCREITRELIEKAMNKKDAPNLRELYINEVHRLRFDHTDLLEPNFDILMGWFSQMLEDEKTFLFWKEEIENKKPEDIATFNPLLGKNYWEISGQQHKIARQLSEVQDLIQAVLRYQICHLETVKKILSGLDTTKQPKFKALLISILSHSIKDSFLLSGFIPSLYTFLFDPHSVKVREEAMKFLNKLAENNTELMTQTLLDLTDIFLGDQEVAIRGMALEIQETLFEKSPTKFNASNIDTIIKAMVDPYVYIHKKAARISETFFPVMSQAQKWETVATILQLLLHYKEKDISFSRDCMKILLRISKEFPNVLKRVVTEFLVGLCRTGEWHDRKEFIEMLEEVCERYPEYEDDWFKIVLDLFRIIQPGQRGDMDWRAEMYKNIHKRSRNCILRNIATIDDFIKTRNSAQGYDIVHWLEVLCYFEFHNYVVSYVTDMDSKIQRVASTEWIHIYAKLLNLFAEFEQNAAKGKFKIDNLKEINDVLQNSE